MTGSRPPRPVAAMTLDSAITHALVALDFAEMAISDYRHYEPGYRDVRLAEVKEAKSVLRAIRREHRGPNRRDRDATTEGGTS